MLAVLGTGHGLCCWAEGGNHQFAQLLDSVLLDCDEAVLAQHGDVDSESGVESLVCLPGTVLAAEVCLLGTEPSWQEYHCCHSGTEWLLISGTLWTDQTGAPGGGREGGEGVGGGHDL